MLRLGLLFAMCTVAIVVAVKHHRSSEEEPACYSRWDYEYKTMKQILKLEAQHGDLQKVLEQQMETISNQARTMEDIQQSGIHCLIIDVIFWT